MSGFVFFGACLFLSFFRFVIRMIPYVARMMALMMRSARRTSAAILRFGCAYDFGLIVMASVLVYVLCVFVAVMLR